MTPTRLSSRVACYTLRGLDFRHFLDRVVMSRVRFASCTSGSRFHVQYLTASGAGDLTPLLRGCAARRGRHGQLDRRKLRAKNETLLGLHRDDAAWDVCAKQSPRRCGHKWRLPLMSPISPSAYDKPPRIVSFAPCVTGSFAAVRCTRMSCSRRREEPEHGAGRPSLVPRSLRSTRRSYAFSQGLLGGLRLEERCEAASIF